MHHSDVFYRRVLQFYGSLHVLRYFVHWDWCIKAMCSTVVFCNSIMFLNSVYADLSGMAESRFLAAAAACGMLLSLAAESRNHMVMAT